jgi:hypothetical protein
LHCAPATGVVTIVTDCVVPWNMLAQPDRATLNASVTKIVSIFIETPGLDMAVGEFSFSHNVRSIDLGKQGSTLDDQGG